MGDLAEPAERLGVHPDEVERDLGSRLLEDVGPEPPAARPEVVDDHDPSVELAGVADALRHEDAVLDHAGRRPAAVPHQVVERRDVDQQGVGVVDRWRVSVGCSCGGSCSR